MENPIVVRELERFSLDGPMSVQSVSGAGDWEKYGFGSGKVTLFRRDLHRTSDARENKYWYYSLYHCGAMDVGTGKYPRSVIVLPKVDGLDIAAMMHEVFEDALSAGDREVLQRLGDMSVVDDSRRVVMPREGTMEWLALWELFHGIALQVVMTAALCVDLRPCAGTTGEVISGALDILIRGGILPEMGGTVLGQDLLKMRQCTAARDDGTVSPEAMDAVAESIGPLVNSISGRSEDTIVETIPQFAVNMSLLFELWCLRRLRRTCGEGDILYQRRFPLCDGTTAFSEYGSVHEWRPDILKVGEGLVIDCKYKTTYGRGMRSDDVMQITGYASLEGVRRMLGIRGAQQVRSLFLYPDSRGSALNGGDLWDGAVCDTDARGRDIYHNVRRLGVYVPVLTEYRLRSVLRERGRGQADVLHKKTGA